MTSSLAVRQELSVHPTVMTMLAEQRALDLRCSASAKRRGRLARAHGRRLFALNLQRPGRRVTLQG